MTNRLDQPDDYPSTDVRHPQAPPRPRASHHDGTEFPRHGLYTIAWICALHIEMAAARAMLDSIHDDLPLPQHDGNMYILGSIKHHGIVVACLPQAEYGTNNAAHVLSDLKRTFPSIRIALMVGIGGGVPSKADIRLGDVVVGTRVMQYDFGKLIKDGKIQRTAIPKFPDYSIRTMLSNLRAKHELEPCRIPSILSERMANHAEYNRPSVPDRLFISTYHHSNEEADCDNYCDPSKLITRRARASIEPEIYYGAIASGNQVVKDSATRDMIARELNVICFEMETAGLMDILPCLPIRGICDYSDSHKAKKWQRYAAATAAAFARELLEALPRRHQDIEINGTNSTVASFEKELIILRARRLAFLRFKSMDSRRTTVRAAYANTCQWFIELADYQAWNDGKTRSDHHGFLWIKGKPGAGKSTIMKFIYTEMKSKDRDNSLLTASFFFNARGDILEKSISGMYRSLLLQLLEGYEDLQPVLDTIDFMSSGQESCPAVNELQKLFRDAVLKLGRRSFICFVDALDECDEHQVMDMVQYFEELAEHCTSHDIDFKLCFASRHYPYIQVRYGKELVLERQDGHDEDLDLYIKSHLRIKNKTFAAELRTQILEKAGGVFLWVVLVVDILNKENTRGRFALKKRFEEVPSGLSELFHDILRRDNDGMEDLLLCILWVLLAARPLTAQEYYHAMWAGLSLLGLTDAEIPSVRNSEGDDYINSFVITSSKGLAEITKGSQQTVQFIHESVKDFLVKDGGLNEIWPELGYEWQGLAHDRLKQCCFHYISHGSVRHWVVEDDSGPYSYSKLASTCRDYPLLKYACSFGFYHANAAADSISQAVFLVTVSVPEWISTHNFLETICSKRYSLDSGLIYVLATEEYMALMQSAIKVQHLRDARSETNFCHPLLAALVNVIEGIARCLIENGADITVRDENSSSTLHLACRAGLPVIVKYLIDHGLDINDRNVRGETPLLNAIYNEHLAVVQLLLEARADCQAADICGVTPIQLALNATSNRDGMVKELIERDKTLVFARDSYSVYMFHLSLIRCSVPTVTLFVKNGVYINVRHIDGRSALTIAVDNDLDNVVDILKKNGARRLGQSRGTL